MSDPIGDVVRAFTVPGPNPDAHHAAVSRLRQDWPTLADALARLVVAVNHVTVRVPPPWPDPPTPGTIRDLIHFLPVSTCWVGSDTCPDWPLADRMWRVWADEGPEAFVLTLIDGCNSPEATVASMTGVVAPPVRPPNPEPTTGRPDPMKPHARRRLFVRRRR